MHPKSFFLKNIVFNEAVNTATTEQGSGGDRCCVKVCTIFDLSPLTERQEYCGQPIRHAPEIHTNNHTKAVPM